MQFKQLLGNLCMTGFCMLASGLHAQEGRYQAPYVVEFDLTKGLPAEKPEELADIKKLDSGTLNWHLSADQKGATVVFDLEKMGINPSFYDEIQVKFKNKNSLVALVATILDFPVSDMRRNWYSKIAMKPGVELDWRCDLQLDDDSVNWGYKEYGGQKFTLTLGKRYLSTTNELPTRDIEIESVRFLRRPVTLSFDEFEAVCKTDPSIFGDTIKWTYFLNLKNNESKPHTVTLKVNDSALKNFKPDWSTKNITLNPREKITVPLTCTIPVKSAYELPPLFSEKLLPSIKIETVPELPEFYTVLAYRPRYMWLTVPPKEVKLPAIPEDRQKKIIAEADKELKSTQFYIPDFAMSAHPQQYIDTKTNSTLKPVSWFRQKIDKTGEIIVNNMWISSANITAIHSSNFNRILTLAQAWNLTGNPVYAEAARDRLLLYADMYGRLPMAISTTSTGFRTRLGRATLMSSYIFDTVTDAYAYIKNSPSVSADDREKIEKQFIIPEMTGLYGHNVEYTNMQAEHFKAYGCAVLAMNDHWNLLGEATYGDHGFYGIVDNSFSDDGMSQEGKAYHAGIMHPLMKYVARMQDYGINLYTPRFKRVFDGLVNNSPFGVADFLPSYMKDAYKAYGDKAYLPTLKHYKYMSEEELAKLDGADSELVTSNILKSNGFIWLREKSEFGKRALFMSTSLNIDRGEHDQLHFNLFDDYSQISGEMGRIIYSAPQGWVMEKSWTHNIVTIDGKNHSAMPSDIAAFLSREKMPAVLITDSKESPLYPGVSFSRVAAIFDGIQFVGDMFASKDEHVYDRPFMPIWNKDAGIFKYPFQLTPYSGKTGYEVTKEGKELSPFNEVKSAEVTSSFAIETPLPAERNIKEASGRILRIMNYAEKGMSVLDIRIPRGYRPENGGPMFMLRQKGKNAVFAQAFEVIGKDAKPRVKDISFIPLKGVNDGISGSWMVSTDTARYLIVVNRTGGEVEASGVRTKAMLDVIKLK